MKCPYCSKWYRAKQTLLIHIEKTHPNEKTEKTVYKCSFCTLEFKGEKCYEKHIQSRHKAEGFICEQCGLNFLIKTCLNQHIARIHKNEKILKCPHCPKSFSNNSNLERHILLHTQNKKTYICELCALSYFSQSALKEHSLTHKTVKDFQCKICQKSFALKRTLLRHEATHDEERKFKCNICPQSYKTKSHLTRHKQTHKSKTTEFKSRHLKRFTKNEHGELIPTEEIIKEPPKPKKRRKKVLKTFAIYPNQTNFMNILEEENINTYTAPCNSNNFVLSNQNDMIGMNSLVNGLYPINHGNYSNCENNLVMDNKILLQESNNDLNQYPKHNLQHYEQNYIPDANIQLNDNSIVWHNSYNENINNKHYKAYPLNGFYSEDMNNVQNTNNQMMNVPNMYLNYGDMWQSESEQTDYTNINNIDTNSQQDSYINIGGKLTNLELSEQDSDLKSHMFNDDYNMIKPNKSLNENMNDCKQEAKNVYHVFQECYSYQNI